MAEPVVKADELVKCDLCEDGFNSSLSLTEHKKTNHAVLKINKEGTQNNLEGKEIIEVKEVKVIDVKKVQFNEVKEVKIIMEVKEEKDHVEVKEENGEQIIELNYILDELKNLKVAKLNARKTMETKKIITNDLNTRFEMNSALYLVTKEELVKLLPGQSVETKVAKIEVESKSNQIDKVENNPATIIKFKVTEVATNFESKLTMHLNHTNQGIHLQGGRRNGTVTTCSLVADYLEDYFKMIQTTQERRIKNIKFALLKLDLRKNFGKEQKSAKEKQSAREKKVLQNCPKCHYKTVNQAEMKRHTFKQHLKNTLIVSVATENEKSTNESSNGYKPSDPINPVFGVKPLETVKEAEKLTPVESENLVKPKEPKTECLRCRFDCDTEHELVVHDNAKHDDSKSCNNCKTKDTLLSEQINKIERLELEVSNFQSDLKASKLETKKIADEKEIVQTNYQEASRVIAEQQRKLTECLEKLKVTESLSKIGEETKAAEGNIVTEEWEEVWEDKDDKSGDLVIQRRKELAKYQWKPELACKKM